MEKLSVLIITYNEEANIEAALKSVSFADEVVLVDSGSTDNTREIALRYSARVHDHEFESYAKQKNWGLDQCTHEWVLIIDADERIPVALRDEIYENLFDPMEAVAFSIKRTNYFMGQRVRFSGWQNDRVIRLVKRRFVQYAETAVHEEMQVEGQYVELTKNMEHFTYRDLNSYLEKSWKYATLGAHDRLRSHGKVTAYHLLVKPIWGFMSKYVFRLGFLDGQVGLVIAMQHSSYLFNRALKLWRLQEGENIPIK